MIAVGTEALPLFAQDVLHARSRRSDPTTSHQAGNGLRNLTERHRAVWECLRTLGPSPDFALEARYDAFADRPWWTAQTAQSLRSRRKMLQLYGLVVTDGTRRPSPNGGHPALVWAAVDPERAITLFQAP